MFRIDPCTTSRVDKFVPINKVRASVRTNSITASQHHVITKKVVNSDSNGFSSTRVDIATKTIRTHPRSNTKNDRVPSAFQSSCIKNKEVGVKEHHRNLLLSKNKNHMPSKCNNITLAIQNDKYKVICAMCKKCLITANHDICVLNYVNDMNSCGMKQKAKVPKIANQTKLKPQVMKPKKVRSNERLALPKPSKTRSCLRWSPTGRIFDRKGNIIESNASESQSECSNGDNAYIEVAFRRNSYFVKNLEGVDLLKGNRSTNLYTINLHDKASASPICLVARATSTKLWLWHQRLSHLNFDTINDLARNNLVTGVPKFKYHKEHLCPLREQGKSKRASHPPKPVSNSKQRLHLLHMDLCGPMRIASINGKRYVLVIVDDYSRYTWGKGKKSFWGPKIAKFSSDDQDIWLGTIKDLHLELPPEGGVLLGPERPRTYDDLSDMEKKRYDADVRATNIVLQGLPKDIYKLINHNIEAKAIWDNVKMLLEVLNSPKKIENLSCTMNLNGSRCFQLNSKFVNNMSPEWDRFVTAIKLNKGLKETNHEQLYAYLKQHEKHDAQDRLIIERITPTTNDQLAFVLTVQPYA
ncbi:retrovirus-related pol polyprotein from transposon TNT 1-94 [Tanacetum coccineum]